MSKISLTNLVNLQNETTAVSALNANNAVLTTALDNTLSRDGTSPNTMGANLDMNSRRILNLPTPLSNYEPIRFIDANALKAAGTITVSSLPVGGTTGQILSKTSGTDFAVNWTSSVPALNIGTNLALPAGAAFAVNKNAAALPTQSFAGETFMARIAGVDGTAPIMSIEAYGSFPALVLQRADGTGVAPTAVQSGEVLGAVTAHAYGSTAFNGGASQLRFVAGQTWTDAVQGTYASIFGTPNGSTAASVTEIARFVPSAVTLGSAGANFTAPVSVTLTVTQNTAALPSNQPNSANEVWAFQIGMADSTPGGMGIDSFGNAGNAFSVFDFRRANGTAAAKTALQANDLIGVIGALGYGTTGYSAGAAQIRFRANQTWSDTAQGSSVSIGVTPNNTVAVTNFAEIIRFENDAGITVPATVTGGSKGAGTLNLSGSLYDNGTAPTGTNGYVRSTAPTFITNIKAPLLIGGSGTTGTQLVLQTTTGNGTTDSFAINGGNNGALNFLALNSTGVAIVSNLAVPAGGTTGTGIKFSSTANLGVFFGSGVPTLSAAQGSLYVRTDGSTTSTRMYINTTGSTVWTNVTTAT